MGQTVDDKHVGARPCGSCELGLASLPRICRMCLYVLAGLDAARLNRGTRAPLVAASLGFAIDLSSSTGLSFPRQRRTKDAYVVK